MLNPFLLPLYRLALAAPLCGPALPPGSPRSVQLTRVPGSDVAIERWIELEPGANAGTEYHRIRLAPERPWSRARRTDARLHLRAGTFDPLVEAAPSPPAGWEAAGELYLVQFITQSLAAYRRDLESRGAHVLQFFPNNTHVVRLEQGSAADLEQLEYVRWVGRYHAGYRVAPELLAAATPELRVRIQLYERGRAARAQAASRLQALGAHVASGPDVSWILEARLTPEQLRAAAALDEVHWIDAWSPVERDMWKVRIDGGADYIESVAGFTGSGVRGEVFDDNVDASHQALQSNPILFHGPHAGSLLHGTATTGIAFGDGTGNSQARGLLPDGQPIFADFGSYGGDRYAHTAELLLPPYEAVFQTNSWGNSVTSAYTSVSMELDDILFENDIALTQSHGNAGGPVARPQAWSKNLLSVGGINHNNTLNPNDDTSSGASTGPAADGRIKPDLAYWFDGVTTLGPGGGTLLVGGTSSATAQVAGYLGLFFGLWHAGLFGNPTGPTVFASRPKATTARAMLINGARQYPFSGAQSDLSRVRQGWGRPNVRTLYDARDDYLIVDESDVLGNLESALYTVQVAPNTAVLAATVVYLDPAGNPGASQHRINDLSLKVVAPGGVEFFWGNNGLLEGNWSTPGGESNRVDVVENVFIPDPRPGSWTIHVLADELVQDGHVETAALDADYALVVRGVAGAGGAPCDPPTPYCLGAPNSVHPAGAGVTGAGSTSLAANDLTFHVTRLPASQFGLFFYGPDQASQPSGSGTVCIGGSLFRLNPVQANAAGELTYALNLTQLPSGGAITSGSTWNFQFWYRDPAATGSTYNFSDALAVTFCD